MHAANAPTPGHHQAVGVLGGVAVRGQRHRRRRPARARARRSGGCPTRSRGRRPPGSWPVRGHSALGRGHAVSRGSSATASRSARANALNCASTMWCGSRPDSTRTCSAIWAWKAIVSKTCRVSEPTYGAVAADRDVRLALGLAGVHAVGTAGDVDDGLDQRLVERHGGVAEAADADLVAERLAQRLRRARSRCPRRCGGRRCGCRRSVCTTRSTSECRANAASMWS